MRARVEHVFGRQKDRMNLMVHSIGIKRAEATIIVASSPKLSRKHVAAIVTHSNRQLFEAGLISVWH